MTRRIARATVALLLGLAIAIHAFVAGADVPAPQPAATSEAATATACPYWAGCSDWKLIEVNLTPYPVSPQA